MRWFVIAGLLKLSLSHRASACSAYLSYNELKSWYSGLAKEQPDRIGYSPIGSTHEGREMFALHMGNGTRGVVYMQGLVHAREWATGPILANVIKRLASSEMLNQLQVVVVPVANPDGYEYSRTVDRLWRKNRAPQAGGVGVDLNRNYPARWDQATQGLEISEEVYRGESAGSEKEVQAVMQHLLKSNFKIKGALDFHGFGKYILFPPAYSANPTPALLRTQRIGEEMSNLIQTEEEEYIPLPIATFSPATGSMVEWAYLNHSSLSYAIEVSPSLNENMDISDGFFPDPKLLARQADRLMPAINHFLSCSIHTTCSVS